MIYLALSRSQACKLDEGHPWIHNFYSVIQYFFVVLTLCQELQRVFLACQPTIHIGVLLHKAPTNWLIGAQILSRTYKHIFYEYQHYKLRHFILTKDLFSFFHTQMIRMFMNVNAQMVRMVRTMIMTIVVKYLAYNTRRIHMLSILTFFKNT